MKNNYGNLYFDIQLIAEGYKLIGKTVSGDELSSRKLDIFRKNLGQDLNALYEYSRCLEDAYSKFSVNINIRNVEQIFDALTLTSEQEMYISKCIRSASLSLYKTPCIESKKKTLALINFTVRKMFDNNYSLFSRIFSARWISLVDIDITPGLIFSVSLEETIIKLLEGLTPNDILHIFPLEKTYDGYKLETKDYYSCRREIDEIGLHTKMDLNKVQEFIMECVSDGFLFNVGLGIMSSVSDYNNWDITDIVNMFEELNKPKLSIVK